MISKESVHAALSQSHSRSYGAKFSSEKLKGTSAAVPPSVSSQAEEQKRRQQRQNNDIIRVNAMYATQLRIAESEKKTMSSENFELRTELSRLLLILDSERKDRADLEGFLEDDKEFKKVVYSETSFLVEVASEFKRLFLKLESKVSALQLLVNKDDTKCKNRDYPSEAKLASKLEAKFPSAEKSTISNPTKKSGHKTFVSSLETILEEPYREENSSKTDRTSEKCDVRPPYQFPTKKTDLDEDRMELVTSPQSGFVSNTFLDERVDVNLASPSRQRQVKTLKKTPTKSVALPTKQQRPKPEGLSRTNVQSKLTPAGYSPPSSPPIRGGSKPLPVSLTGRVQASSIDAFKLRNSSPFASSRDDISPSDRLGEINTRKKEGRKTSTDTGLNAVSTKLNSPTSSKGATYELKRFGRSKDAGVSNSVSLGSLQAGGRKVPVSKDQEPDPRALATAKAAHKLQSPPSSPSQATRTIRVDAALSDNDGYYNQGSRSSRQKLKPSYILPPLNRHSITKVV